MTDASVGAKTGVDLPQKNLVGAFKQPELVFVDMAVLETLPAAEVRSGLAEVIKHGLIGDSDLFEALARTIPARRTSDRGRPTCPVDPGQDQHRAGGPMGERSPGCLGPRSHGWPRTGAIGGYQLRHGEAVAIGMVASARIAERMWRTGEGLSDRVINLLSAMGLPVMCPPWPVSGSGRRCATTRNASERGCAGSCPEPLVGSSSVTTFRRLWLPMYSWSWARMHSGTGGSAGREGANG